MAKPKFYVVWQGRQTGVYETWDFLKEIPDIFTVRTSIPIKSVVEKVITCKKCFSQLEKLWVACPYCMEKVTDDNNEQEKLQQT